ncbi:MAG TPA: type II secretion system ATPase GspE [Moraxellaceae bacterium]|nr:type II secretion system ATPase GspE [Moraxellaceae bacterium]
MDTLLEENAAAPAAPVAPRRFPYAFAKRHGVLLDRVEDGQAHLFHRPGLRLASLAEARRLAGLPLTFEEVTPEVFSNLLARAYQTDSSESMQMVEGLGDEMDLASLAELVPEAEDLMEQEDDAPIIRLINALLTEAIRESASDIHIETYEKRLSVRLRVDGVLREIVQPKRELAPLLVSRIKVMARLDIAEKRVPQDGRISLRLAGREVDVRVSTMPSSNGERVVLRLLDKQSSKLDLSHLGMSAHDHAELSALINKPHGIILVTGPTGSGKTTTLYAGLTELNDKSRNILTVEDPIEYQLDGIGQTQVNSKVDMTFARGLRAILRQDPDVVMVGEIRDLETAEIAVQASLTGHLVLSTLHTNSAVGAVTRLHDMGIEPFLLSSSLLGVLAQRLVRVLCKECREPYVADAYACAVLGVDPATPPTVYKARGCVHCNGLGYRGRTGIYELIVIDEEMRRLIHNHAGEHELEAHARRSSTSLRQDGTRRVLDGVTTLEEVLRVSREG